MITAAGGSAAERGARAASSSADARVSSQLANDLFAVCRPARHFSGDVWFWHREREELWLALADVAGKGIGAAVFMAMIAEELERRLGSRARPRLPDLVADLNATLRREMPVNRFATLVVGHLDAAGTLRLVNAGHCPALVRRRSGAVEAIHSSGPVLGILPEARFDQATLHLAPGETTVLFSDGLLEATSADGRELGLERIARALGSDPAIDAAGVAASLLAELDTHLAGEAAGDDVSLLVLCRPSTRH